MKLSFTTAGCPGWSWNEIFATAKDLGLGGVEIRGIGDTIYAPAIEVFAPDAIENTKAQLSRAGMSIPVLDSTAALAVDGAAEAAMIEAKAYIDLASKLGTPFVRVMSTEKAEPGAADLEQCAELYEELCVYGEQKNVTPLMETNSVLADSAALAAFMEKIACENKGVLWDVHHPFRFFGESAEKTVANIGKFIRHTHVKDSCMKDGQLQYRMMGYGDVPVADAVAQLKKIGYEGFVSLEWLKRWNPTLQEPGIVFAHFKSYMDFILNA